MYTEKGQVIDNNTLVALTILIAESNPKEKEVENEEEPKLGEFSKTKTEDAINLAEENEVDVQQMSCFNIVN